MRESDRNSGRFAKHLRRRMTDAEVILWSRSRRASLAGHRFRRQHPVGNYIADFACVAGRPIVEVDGVTHSSASEILHDTKRDAFLRAQGWRVFRVRNIDVYENLEDVLEGIYRALPPPPLRGPPPP